jgi:outer membrane receptor protein involved in Fe transport
MRKVKSLLVAFLLSNIFIIGTNAQNVTISGNVKNSQSNENLSAVSVAVKGAAQGTFSSDKGSFSISIKSLPATIVFSSIGFETKEMVISDAANKLSVSLNPASTLGQEIVVSASRVPEKILESPVSVERISAANIRNSAGANYYDILKSLKGVDITTASLTFATPTTRGFNSSGNTRFNQLVDGMDNQAPGLNFSVASIIGLSEMDIDNMELLSGASSALYGSGGMNGTLLLTSKNPFKYQGFSVLAKEGVMHINGGEQDPSPYHNFSVRYAKKVNDKFAFKINAEYISAQDWLGYDYRNYARAATGGKVIAGTRASDPNYDGINVYGDETTTDIRQIIRAVPWLQNFPVPTTPINVSRTGYTEREIVNPQTINFKLSGSLHYKLSEKTEAIFAGYWGTGNTTYTGSERYSLQNFKMGQYKLELNNKDWTLRAFTTQENSGDSYNTTVATRLFNESWSPSVTYGANGSPNGGWYIDYTGNYVNSRLGGASEADAHAAARLYADRNRPAYNSTKFKNSYDSIRAKTLAEGGAKLLDKSAVYMLDGNYNLTKYTSKVADVIVGGSFKRYILNSEGNLFADKPDSSIGISEFGAFAQATRKLGSRVKLAVSGRYDKNQNFAGRFTPRATATFKVAEFNHLRVSYQTAYRFPSNQQQYIDLVIGSNVRLIGGNDYFVNKYNFNQRWLYDFEALRAGNTTRVTPVEIKPESISSFEAGYKGLLSGGKLLVDVYGYWGQYQNFIGRRVVVQSLTSQTVVAGDTSAGFRYSIPVNSTDKVKTYGFGASFDYRLPKNFGVGFNVSSDVLKDVPANFVAYFNSPKYKTNISVSNSGFGPHKKIGFNLSYKWQQGMLYEGDFATGNIPEVNIVDMQVSYKLPKTKSILKFGANNLLNSYYYNAIGNSQIGGLYYVSFGYNVY